MTATEETKKVVFLGTPAVAAQTLDTFLKAQGDFEVVACVSQPAAMKGRKKVLVPSDVTTMAQDRGVDVILTPPSARDSYFLHQMRLLKPDLCVTAAYGQFLPTAFLDIPTYGTWNIHPSLLPKWRGAAPLQRALEAGDKTVGVSVLETVLKMDAGPIVAQQERLVTDDDTAENLLNELFQTGIKLLIENMPDLWRERVAYRSQTDDDATKAAKLDVSEARLRLLTEDDSDPRSIAERARDKVRAFSPWPGTWVNVLRSEELQRLKILSAHVGEGGADDITFEDNALLATCADGSTLAIDRVLPANGKPMDAAAYWNGLQGKPLRLAPDDDPLESS